jgi:hypothetical protein
MPRKATRIGVDSSTEFFNFGLDTTSKGAVKENTMVYTAKLNPPQKHYPKKPPAGASSSGSRASKRTGELSQQRR